MRTRLFAVALFAPIIAMGSSLFSAGAAEDSSCGVSPSEAVTSLPAPLDKWAQIICTQSGQVITGHEGWVWMEPMRHAIVIIPSQNLKADSDGVAVDQDSGTGGGKADKSYFTKVEFTKVNGDEFAKVYGVFHSGFDENDGKPAAYRLELKTMSGKVMRLYMFDYFTYGWGMACSEEACDPASRFVMLNMSKDPKPLPPPI